MQHFALLTAYGAGAVNPYLALATLDQMQADGYSAGKRTRTKKLHKNYIKAAAKGLLKVMSKMGISTQQSYRGAQIFEAIGLNSEFVNEYLHLDAQPHPRRRARRRSPKNRCAATSTPIRAPKCPQTLDLDVGGQYQWRRKGEAHMINPDVVAKLQHATRINSREEFKQVLPADRRAANAAIAHACAACSNSRWPSSRFRSTKSSRPRKSSSGSPPGRCRTARSRKEAHETLAIAMNRIGGKSNTGEGGEDSARYKPDANGDLPQQRHQAGGQRPVRRHQRISGERPANCRSRWPRAPSRAKGASCPATRSTRKSPASATARRAWV